MSNNQLVLVYFNGEIVNSNEGVTFTCPNPVCIYVNQNISFDDLKSTIHSQLELEVGKQISAIKYRIPIFSNNGLIQFQAVKIRNDNDVRMMFDLHQRNPNINVIEVYIEVEDIGRSGGQTAMDTSTSCGSYEEHSMQRNICDLNDTSASYAAHNVEPLITPTTTASTASQNDSTIGDFGDSSDDEEEGDEPGSGNEDNEISDAEDIDLTVVEPRATYIPAFNPPEHMCTLHLDAMKEPEFGFLAKPPAVGDLRLGMQFESKEAVLIAVKNYSLLRGVEYKVIESERKKYYGKCMQFGQGCNWLVRASFLKKKQIWEITRYNGDHTCTQSVNSQRHSKLDSNLMSTTMIPILQENPQVSVSVLMDQISSKYNNYKITYRKAWIAKQKAIEKIYGNWEGSYNDLQKWLSALKHFSPGTVYEIQKLPARDANGNLLEDAEIFHRLFWTFRPCIEAFRYCKPLVQIDDTHLYGKYKGTLMVAIAQDGNRNILPIGFAIVEGETEEAWSFFLSNLRIHVTPQEGICVISDNNHSVLAAIRGLGDVWQPPKAFHVFCIHHIAEKFLKSHKHKEMSQLLVNAACAKTEREFNYYYDKLGAANLQYNEWINRIPKEQWTQAFDGGRRYGHMTTNLVQCINSILRGTRNLPITALVQSTYFRLAELFVRKGKEAEAQIAAGHVFSEALREAIQKYDEGSGSCVIRPFSQANELFFIEEQIAPQKGGGIVNYKVDLRQRWCDCGEFQVNHFPCQHVLAVCGHMNVDWQQYVDDVYKLQTIFNVYRREFDVVRNEGYWPPYNELHLYPNPAMRRNPKGRPKSTCIHNEMDSREPGQRKRCGFCRLPGHSRSNCPNHSG